MSDKVGIVYSPGFGAGWSTWGKPESALDQELVRAIDSGKPLDEIIDIAEKNWPDEYTGGLEDAVVCWVDKGTMFEIHEYDGYESIRFREDPGWLVAS